jgi:hypothetical protein
MSANPKVRTRGIKQRKRHKEEYYTANANIKVSRAVKQGLCEIADIEERSLSWIVNEVFRFYFGLKDDTQYLGLMHQRKVSKLRRVNGERKRA